MSAVQTHRLIEISTSLGDDVLLFHHMEAREELGRLFEYRVNLLSENEQISFDDILGQKMTVRLDLPDGAKRYFNGVVSHFAYTGRYRDYASYRAVLSPWLWFLTRTADCRIFQNKTVPDIIKEIFREQEHGFIDFDDLLSGQYRTCEYCVQYRETDFNFVSRLMEREGIYYYFKHEKDKHTLVLADSIGAHNRIPGYERVPYYPPTENVVREEDHIFDWYLSREVQPGVYVLDDFDFKRPKAELKVKRADPRPHAASEYEVFDYPGEYVASAEGEGYVRARLEELQARWERVRGEGNAGGLSVGGLFELTKYPRNDQNREYLLVSAVHKLRSDAYETGVSPSEPTYSCEFEALGSQQPYRSPRTTVKPIVQGPQTAIVRGPAGDEIYTDQYGRVKVQFHWDRYGKNDENSSCWIRVSHAWAGQNWGMVAIPRMGQEVIVDFLEGDPDQPIITGRVYNADQMPPYGLPANATQTGILSRSSKGGSAANCNELRFEDKKGAEQVYLHAEKNQDIGVENDETHWVGHDRTKTIDHDETVLVKHDRKETVDNNETITIGVNRVEKVGNNEIITIGNDHTETIQGSMMATVNRTKSENVLLNSSETIGLAKELTIGGLYQVSVGGAHNTTVGGVKAVEVGGYSAELVGGAKNLTVGGNHTVTVRGKQSLGVTSDRSVNVDGKSEQTVKGEHVFKAKKIDITAEDEMIITVGSAKLVLKKDGTILLDGKDINTKASGKVNVKASGDIIHKGSSIKEN